MVGYRLLAGISADKQEKRIPGCAKQSILLLKTEIKPKIVVGCWFLSTEAGKQARQGRIIWRMLLTRRIADKVQPEAAKWQIKARYSPFSAEIPAFLLYIACI